MIGKHNLSEDEGGESQDFTLIRSTRPRLGGLSSPIDLVQVPGNDNDDNDNDDDDDDIEVFSISTIKSPPLNSTISKVNGVYMTPEAEDSFDIDDEGDDEVDDEEMIVASDGDNDGYDDDDDDDDDDDLRLFIPALSSPKSRSVATSTVAATKAGNAESTEDIESEDESGDEQQARRGSSGGGDGGKNKDGFPRVCTVEGCGQVLTSSAVQTMHRRGHQTSFTAKCKGTVFTFTRESTSVPWPCPSKDCESGPYSNILKLLKHACEAHAVNGSQQQQQQQQQQRKQRRQQRQQQQIQQKSKAGSSEQSSATSALRYVANFVVRDVRCGYHLATGAFICLTCRMVPESLTSHLQATHGLGDLISINNSLPLEATSAGHDPAVNQHIANSNLVPKIDARTGYFVSSPHPDVVAGFLCTHPGCTHTASVMKHFLKHWHKAHTGTRPQCDSALVLRIPITRGYHHLFISHIKTNTSSQLPARATSNNAAPANQPISPQPSRRRRTTKSSAMTPVKVEEPIITVPTRLMMPQFIPSLVDPLLFTQSDGTALSLNDIRSFSDRLLADANTLLRKVLYGYSGSTSWQLDDKSFSDLGHNESGFGSHLTTPCDEELQRYYSHLETTTPQIKAAIMGTSAPDVTPDYSALASGHDQLLGMLLVFLVITGGPVPITEQELASLRIIDDEVHNRSLSIHNGSILLLSVRTNLDRSESIVVRALPQGVSQLLLDFLVLVRRPLINAIFRSGNLEKAFSLKDFLCAPANSAMHSDCANVALTEISQQYLGCRLSMANFYDVAATWAYRLKYTSSQIAAGNPPSTLQLATAMDASFKWHDVLLSRQGDSTESTTL